MTLIPIKLNRTTAHSTDIKKDPHRYAVQVCDARMLKVALLLVNKDDLHNLKQLCKK